jgi:hypothetical protein
MTDLKRSAKLIRIIFSMIENLEEEQIEQLLDGNAKLSFGEIKKSKVDQFEFSGAYSEILSKLNACDDRTMARGILSMISSRDTLASFARSLKIHVVKADRREDIETKIIEFIIGGRLRNEAIRTLNLKGGTSNS